ncbi:MAG TPA: glycosyltransferase [Burkholderiaceae bacterium]|nr:glycosyltransferase [Burkholderiaceae bacterium]
MIPKTLHIIWIGDESKRPNNCIQTWIEKNPAWQIKIWDNQALASHGWINGEHMRVMARRELNGVADMMRWEILYNEGGFVVDADSICVRSLDDWLLAADAFACWENEIARPGLIAAGYVASIPQNPFFGQIIIDIRAEASVVDKMAWETVGPMRLTVSHRKYRYSNLTILPSHLFIPRHFTGISYTGSGPVYAKQEWGSTLKIYDDLHLRKVA